MVKEEPKKKKKKQLGTELRDKPRFKKIPKYFLSKNERILKIEQESILGCRMICNSDCRPYDAYAISSNNTFEFCRFEMQFRCTVLCLNRPELHVYRTQYKYQETNDHFQEVFIGKLVPEMTVINRKIRVYETSGSEDGTELNLKYEVTESIGECLKDLICLRLPFGPCK